MNGVIPAVWPLILMLVSSDCVARATCDEARKTPAITTTKAITPVAIMEAERILIRPKNESIILNAAGPVEKKTRQHYFQCAKSCHHLVLCTAKSHGPLKSFVR